MAKKIFIAALVILSGFCFSNCEKENTCDHCPDTQLIDPSNPENPFDEIGTRHNAGLVFLGKYHQAAIDAAYAASPAEAERYIFAQSAAFAGSDPELYPQLRSQFRLREVQLLSTYKFSEYTAWLNLLDIDRSTRDVLRNSIETVMRTEPGTTGATNDIIGAIKAQERLLLAQENLPGRDFALVFMSVWRHSNHHWMQEQGGGQGTTRAKWWEITLADAACGAVGFLLGGPVAGVGLGVGASKAVAGIKD